jgi:hypothetical protein
MAQLPHFYVGREGGRYEQLGAAAGPYFATPRVGRGAAAGDLDNDGRVDLVVIHRDAPAAVLRNVSDPAGWLGLRLRGKGAPGPPVGARVACTSGETTVVRYVSAGTGYLTQHDERLYFGLGRNGRADRVVVTWPSGRVESREGLTAGKVYAWREGEPPAAETPR